MSRNEIVRANNPLAASGNFAAATEENTMGAVASAGEIARVQAQLVYAANRPRNEQKAVDRMLNSFQRQSLASVSLYQYARGGSDITGLSIRAAEAMAMAWGNIDFGLRELDQKNGESTVEAFAWDLETNVRRSITFRVPHYRDTKRGRQKLEDSRDIYEMVANQGSRRVRACILAVIPRDIQDTVEQQVENTMRANFEITPEYLKNWLAAFAKFGVTKEQLEARIQRRFDTITPAQMMGLVNIYNSLKDGIGKVEDFFEVAAQTAAKATTLADKAKAAQKTASAESDNLTTVKMMIGREIESSHAPVAVEDVLKYAAEKKTALTIETDVKALVKQAAEASLALEA